MKKVSSVPTFRRNTLHDVARLAGVSYQTVSRVINHHPYVSDETRERVEKAIIELNYRPNRAAQSLAGAKSRTLAMLTFGLNNYGPAQMMIHSEHASRQAGYDLIFANVNDAKLETLRTAIHYARYRDVDGLLVITPIIGMHEEELVTLSGDIPLMLIGTGLNVNAASVVVDQYAGTRQVTRHLIELGHTQICEISGPLTWYDALERHESWLVTMQAAGLTPGISIEGNWTAESGYLAVRQLIKQGAKFTALVMGNDQMALGAIRALHEYGRRVPEDVSVVGFDDIPEASFFLPPLTTVRQDFDTLGRRGIESLIQRIHQPHIDPKQHVIAPQLIQRNSTAAPPK